MCKCVCLHIKDTCGNERTGSGVCSPFHPFETVSFSVDCDRPVGL